MNLVHPTLCALRTDPQVVIKTIELSPSLYERCVLPDAYSEVLMLERYKV